MKDLRVFTGVTEIGRLRVDSLNTDSTSNLTVMETYFLNDRSADLDPADPNFQTKVGLADQFIKIPSNFGEIIEFSTANSLGLVVQDVASKAKNEVLIGGVEITASSPLPGGTTTVAYSTTITTSGGSSNFRFSVSSGTLPAGLSLNASTGVISGTPTTAGTQVFDIAVNDLVYGNEEVKEFSLTIA